MKREMLPLGGWFLFWPHFVAEHAHWMQVLLAELPLRVEHLWLFGRAQQTPRRSSWHGDAGCDYRYSGRLFAPEPWTPALGMLRHQVSSVAGAAFNAVLANHYRDGRDSMGWHADDEPELGPHPRDIRVASLSLGARRPFVLQARRGARERDPKRYTWALGEGDLLVMGGETQRHYVHAVPKTRRLVGPRLNLTFRCVGCSRNASP